MNSIKSCRLSLLFIFLGFLNLNGQDYIPFIHHLTLNDGLSSREVFSIHEAKDGFVWLGTRSGLNRYDGTGFKVFYQKKDGLAFDEVHFIMEDDEGYLWLFNSSHWYFKSSVADIVLFHPEREEVISLEKRFGSNLPFSKHALTGFCSDENGKLFFGTQNGELVTYSKGKFSVTKVEGVNLFTPEIATEDGIWGYQMEPELKVLKVSEEGLVLDEIVHEVKNKKKSQWIYFAGIDNENTLWYYYPDEENFQLCSIDENREKKKHEAFSNAILSDVSSKTWYFSSVIHPNQNLFWQFIEGHASKAFDLNGNLAFNLGENYPELSELTVYRLSTNKKGNQIWLGTSQGFYIIELRENKFTRYLHVDPNSSVEKYSCRGILKLKDKLYVGNYKTSGKVDLKSGELEPFPTEINGYSLVYPHVIMDNGDGTVWIGENNLLRLDTSTSEIEVFPYSDSSLSKTIWAIHKDKNGKIWTGSVDIGLGYLDEESGTIMPFELPTKEPGLIYKFLETSDNTFYIISSKGMYHFDPDKGVLGYYWLDGKGKYKMPCDGFLDGYLESDSILWLGTSGCGVMRLNLENGDIKMIAKSEGLADNVIYSIYPDEYNNFWLSSNFGIIKLDRATEESRNWLPKDGTSHFEFNRISHYQDKNGQLYFGSLNGITSFHPKDFKEDEPTLNVPMRITKFLQFDGEEDRVIDKTLSLKSDNLIEVRPSDRFFDIEFALLDYSSKAKINYLYKIEGIHNDWIYTEDNFLRFSSLPYGDFVLKVKGQNENSQWSVEELKIPLKVYRPFYLKTGFIILSALSLALFTLGFWQWRVNKFKREKVMLEEEVAERTAQIRKDKNLIERQAEALMLMDQLKSRFFANISHELRTPLTLILGPLSTILKRGQMKPNDQKLLDIIKVNGENLLKRINEILELSKLEAGKLELIEKPINLFEVMERLVNSFDSLAEIEQVELKFDYIGDKKAYQLMDIGKYEKIVNNLISNAIKFTPRGGAIKVLLKQETKETVLSVKDDGIGIHTDDVPHVFDRFYQSTQTDAPINGGTGIGLALTREYVQLMKGKITVVSELKKGSLFTAVLPKKSVNKPTDIVDVEIESTTLNFSKPETVAPLLKNSGRESTILVVEDNLRLREYLEIVLSPHFNIILAENGKVALELLKDLDPSTVDLILSDVMMPEVDGFTLLRELKSKEKWNVVPVILLTARAGMEDRLTALRIGIDDYMVKPFEEEELLARINALLENYLQRKAFIKEEESQLKEKEQPADKEKVKLSVADLEWLEVLENKLKENLRNNSYTFDQLAYEINISKRHLQRKLKRLTGLTPIQYFREMKLQSARKLLETGAYNTVSEVCYAIGFEDRDYFASIFKKRFGKTPSSFLAG